MKTIYHPVLRDTKGYIKYNANRYLCTGCGKVFIITIAKN